MNLIANLRGDDSGFDQRTPVQPLKRSRQPLESRMPRSPTNGYARLHASGVFDSAQPFPPANTELEAVHDRPVSYDLVIWEGERPDSDEAAFEQFVDLAERHLETEDLPPTPAIARYVSEVLRRWPDSDDNGGFGCWAGGGAGDANGHVFEMHILPGYEAETATRAADLAYEHGLVCFDPQQERLRP
ncbi:hypothetical protein IU450_38930 [Nocardia abscessus]|uniref:hypothetical protein n=1 Tax=Nocardia abscessus TaxID=120957 RepID=UPI001894F21F|nr:hypothetical protein [Nocardia abscessus]MBF6341813.1 hypothetical protein [Nocardia abscessus]